MSTLAVGAARTRVELLQFFRERDAVIFNLLFPVILLVIFGSVFDAELPGGVPFTQYFVAGIAAAGVLLTSFQAMAIELCIERDNGTLKRLRTTPMPPVAFFLGKIGQVLATTALQLVLLLTVAVLFFDVTLPSGADLWARFAWIVVLGTAAGTVLGIAFSSVPPNARSASAVVTPPMIVLQFISGVYFVVSDLPDWMLDVASLFPLKWMAQGMRSVFLDDTGWLQVEPSGSWQTTETAVVLVVWLVAGLVLARLTFRWLPRRHG
ncbi:ABC transporter permease [Aquipuribacter nitratireducens]|uniref:Transport permease protein n=1 Tax=Aquipuribacter nitratireducens TaxID=650104 RepID=A0ABW0GHM7_9MICO